MVKINGQEVDGAGGCLVVVAVALGWLALQAWIFEVAWNAVPCARFGAPSLGFIESLLSILLLRLAIGWRAKA